jgi:hypothetical protein
MNKQALDNAEMTFQSFRHSQGNTAAQVMIFRYMGLRYGLEPVLQPNGRDLKRYYSFIAGAVRSKGASHIDPHDPPESGKSRDEILSAFKLLQGEDVAVWKAKASKLTLPQVIDKLTFQVSQSELSMLQQNDGVWSFSELHHGQIRRRAARISQGRASFLFFHGRDGNSTGFKEYDNLYEHMWGTFSDWDGNLEELNDAVCSAEISTLGRLCLGRVEEVV